MNSKSDFEYLDPNQPIEKRVSDLLRRMTTEEKVAQLGSIWVYELFEDMKFSKQKAQSLLTSGIGQITRLGGASHFRPGEAARFGNRIQKYLVENTRLGIPAIIHEECCSGYMTRGATVFPQSIGLAATWNPELVKAMGVVIREQMRSVGAHQALSPVLDVARDPRWGRIEETMGEDPYLIAKLGVAYVTGIQGAELSNGVMATGKHFVGYGNAEGGMNWAPAHIPERELNEVYLFPFEACVKEAGMASVMNSYGELDGIPCANSKLLLHEILRERWGFKGIIVSDYASISMLNKYHHVAPSKGIAAQQAMEAGIDVELPSTNCYGKPLKEMIEEGIISEALVDKSVGRILRIKFLLGLFNRPYVNEAEVAQVFNTPDQKELAHNIAKESVVLLENDKILPLRKDVNSIAIIGPNAHNWRNMIGDYAYPCHVEHLSNLSDEFESPRPEKVIAVDGCGAGSTVLESIKEKVGRDTLVQFAEGCEVMGESREGFPEAVQIAKNSDVVVMVMGGKSGLVEGCTSGESKDRADINLPGVQEELIRVVSATKTPVIVVFIHGRPLSIGWLKDSAAAILTAWLPGVEGGRAIADILFGDVNPGGKLPISFPRSVGQIPVYYSHKPSGGRSHWSGDYIDQSTKPLYPFGYGLSYTQFQYKSLNIDKRIIGSDEDVKVSLCVRNIGEVKGDEVVQLYVHDILSTVTRPVKELKGFKRVSLLPGETKKISFTLFFPQLGFYDRDMNYVVEPGVFEVLIGSSSQDIKLKGTFEFSSEKSVVLTAKRFFSEEFIEK